MMLSKYEDESLYPQSYSLEEKECFDEIRSLAKSLHNAHSIVLEEKENHYVLIEIAEETISENNFKLIDKFNDGSHILLVDYILDHENIKGIIEYGLYI